MRSAKSRAHEFLGRIQLRVLQCCAGRERLPLDRQLVGCTAEQGRIHLLEYVLKVDEYASMWATHLLQDCPTCQSRLQTLPRILSPCLPSSQPRWPAEQARHISQTVSQEKCIAGSRQTFTRRSLRSTSRLSFSCIAWVISCSSSNGSKRPSLRQASGSSQANRCNTG